MSVISYIFYADKEPANLFSPEPEEATGSSKIGSGFIIVTTLVLLLIIMSDVRHLSNGLANGNGLVYRNTHRHHIRSDKWLSGRKHRLIKGGTPH